MIYLNIQTEQRTKEFISEDVTIPVDDPRVAPFFQPVPKKKQGIGYKRGKDENGFPIFKKYQLDENNEFYPFYLEDGTPDFEKINKLKIKEYKQERDKALDSITYTLSDGSVYQVRPQDVPNFQLAIQRNQDVKWILANNNVRLTTVDELKEILNHGIQEGTRIWDEYTQKLEEINQ